MSSRAERRSANEKEEMLARITRALGHTPATPATLPAFDGAYAVPPRAGEALVEQFRAEAEEAGARVERVAGAAEIRQYLGGLLPCEAGATVALSDGLAVGDAGLREWLAGRGLEVVSASPPESAPGATGDGGQVARTDDAGADDAGAGGGRGAGESTGVGEGACAQTRAAHMRALLRACVGITSADYAIAETGTLVLLAGRERHRLVSLLPPVYVCLLDPRRVVADMAAFLRLMRDELYTKETVPPLVTFITGPSCTADVEQTLTRGMHGPRELHVLLYAPDTDPNGGPPAGSADGPPGPPAAS